MRVMIHYDSNVCSAYLLECSRLWAVSRLEESGQWVGAGVDGLFEESVEQQAAAVGGAAVEPEGVLVQVVGQVFLGHRVVQSAGQPAFEQDPTIWTPGMFTCAGSVLSTPTNR